jgi:hypothetical protein
MSHLKTVACKRCGRSITTLTRSLYGADRAHAKYGGICGGCLTPEEVADMERMVLEAVVLRCSGLGAL